MLPFVLATAACLTLHFVGEVRDLPAPRAVGKIGASIAFLAAAWSLGVPQIPGWGPFVYGALVLSAIGDALLLSSERKWFLAGLVVFLLGHVAYGGAFLTLGVSWMAALAAFIPATIVGFLVWGWLAPNVESMSGPVFAYIVVICGMVTLAAGASGHGTVGGPSLLAAAVLFLISDLFVARQRFVVTELRNRLVGLPIYYAAQLLFAWAAATLHAEQIAGA